VEVRNRIGHLKKEIGVVRREIKLKDRDILTNEERIPRGQSKLQEDYSYSKRYNNILLQKKAKLDLLSRETLPQHRSLSVREVKAKEITSKEKEYEELVALLERKKQAFEKNYESKRRAIVLTEEVIARQDKALQELKF
jgi:hypothetical protein